MKISTLTQLESGNHTTPQFDNQFRNLTSDELILQLMNTLIRILPETVLNCSNIDSHVL